YFCFDQDDKRTTRQNVKKAISKTSKLFKKFGSQPWIISWNRKCGKGIDDVLYNFSQSGIEPQEQFSNLYRKALDFDNWESKQLKELTYQVDKKLNRRYLLNSENPSDTLPPSSAQLICLKSPKGTGKTHWMSWFSQPVSRSGEKRILLLTHRIQLSTQTADRLGIPYITQIKDCQTKNLLGQGMCIDSLHPNSQAHFNPEHWGNTYLILDEVMQVIWHLLSSTTCNKERVMIIKTLKQLLQNIIKNKGKIIIADADLSDVAIDFIKGLIGWEVNTFIIENEYKFDNPWTVYNFQDSDPSRLITLLKQKLSLGEKHLLCVSGQKAKSRWGSINLEVYLERKIKEDLPNLRILRIDSETVANPEHPACGCVSNINQIIKEYDLVIATSTIETGVSICEEHFDGVWGIFQGNSTTDGARQFLSRYRLPVPRYIWLKSTGIGFVADKSSNYKSLILNQNKLDKSNLKRIKANLIDCGFEETANGNFEPIALTTWAKLGAIINQGKWNYAAQILSELQEEGHIIVHIKPQTNYIQTADGEKLTLPKSEDSAKTKTEINTNRNQQYQQYRENVTNVVSLDELAYQRLQKQQLRTTDQLLQLRKTQLEHSYCIEVTPELVEKDDNKWYSKIQLDYFWRVNQKFLPIREENILNAALKNGDNNHFSPDTNKKFLGRKVDMLYFLEIHKLYEENVEKFHANHPLIQSIFNKCKANLFNVKLVLGIDFSKITSPIRCVQRILQLIGHRMPFIGREGKAGEQVRMYGQPAADFKYITTIHGKKKLFLDINNLPVPTPDGREEVFQQWLKRDALEEQRRIAAALQKVSTQEEMHSLLDLKFKPIENT
ncbi:MAG: plasmid replication protein, CyRepA1 family, partial [Cyanobacteria bacterium P01_A01_bin.80]